MANSWRADVFIGPKVSTAMGAKRYSLPMLAYFSSLREAASSAAAPALRADPVTYDSARVHMTIKSQHKDWPLCHGMSVRPSGFFPSVQNNPVGSFIIIIIIIIIILVVVVVVVIIIIHRAGSIVQG